MPLKLYTSPQTRGIFTEWYIRELGLTDAQIQELDLAEGEQSSAEFEQVNPFQRVPAIVDGGLKLFESGAIQLYLADKVQGFSSLEERAIAIQWVFLAQTTLSQVFYSEHYKRLQPATLTALDKILESRLYITGKFSAPDVSVASVLVYAELSLKFDFSPYPAIQRYLKHIKARPAYQETIPF